MDLLETVAKGIRESMGMNWHGLSADKKNDYRDYARVAVRLTLEHFRDNVSDGMKSEGCSYVSFDCMAEQRKEDAELCCSAMLSQAISELEAKTEG